MSNEKFDLDKVKNSFTLSFNNNDDVFLSYYLEAFKELFKFFQLMGSVFSFVSSDVKSKVEILEEFRRKDTDNNFHSIKSMINYEIAESVLHKKDYVSGCRTLLRLHRGLDFIRNFLQRLGDLDDNEKSNGICQVAYNETLAKHHPWLIRKGAGVAMYALPTKTQLLNRVCEDITSAIAILPDMLAVTNNVFDRTENLFTANNLHELP